MTKNPTRLLVPALVLLAAATTAWAQVPTDCTGISAVHNTDADLDGELRAVQMASGFTQPVLVTAAPRDLDRLFVVEQTGEIKLIKDGAVSVFMDIDSKVLSGGERGLLGLAFHPDYNLAADPNEKHFFVYYTRNDGDITVERYETSADPDVGDDTSGQVVITVDHPISNHNGGSLAFNPIDGLLYIATGDGGSGCDPGAFPGNAQSRFSNLGKMLRINVDSLPYTNPGNNPYVGVSGNDEIWSIGLRNPFRFSFDRTTGAVYIADVGQDVVEELSCNPYSNSGERNYGWVMYEGVNGCPNPSCGFEGFGPGDCPPADYVAPLLQYGPAASIMGGNVYRGCRMPDLHGHYFYTDYYFSTFMKSFRSDANCALGALVDREADLEDWVAVNNVAGFGEDDQGEHYFVDRGGEVYKIVPELPIMEVSGFNAVRLMMGPSDWTWEDLEDTSDHPIDVYRIYRSEGDPSAVFDCEHRTLAPIWVGGDPDTPAVNEVYYYLITATDDTGGPTEHAHPGLRSDLSLRPVDETSSCF